MTPEQRWTVVPGFPPTFAERPASDWWFVHAGGIIDIPQEPRGGMMSARIRSSVQVACEYGRPTLLRSGQREAALISRDLFEELTAGRPEWQPPSFETPDPGEGL